MLWDLLGATAIAALGTSFWVTAWQGWRRRNAMRQWPTAPASIRGYRTRHAGHNTMVDVEVRYRYQGRDYTVWCMSTSGTGVPRQAPQTLRRVARRFPKASTHAVYVNPARADEAFLTLPHYYVLVPAAGFGALCVGFATYMLLPQVTGMDRVLATLGVMALIGVVITVLVIVFGVALAKPPMRRR
jgi:hypothetical protein